jgi:hypothetical protein
MLRVEGSKYPGKLFIQQQKLISGDAALRRFAVIARMYQPPLRGVKFPVLRLPAAFGSDWAVVYENSRVTVAAALHQAPAKSPGQRCGGRAGVECPYSPLLQG